MSSRRNRKPEEPALDGVLLIDKAPDMTSHDVVAIARRQLGFRKIGHCGTLDPMATGLLILVMGRGTKISDLLMSEEKEYCGELTLGQVTSTQDRQGEVLDTQVVPPFPKEHLQEAFAQFSGEFEQIPPMVSAIKKDGVPLYKHARKGREIERDPRPVEVFESEITNIELPKIAFRVVCTKGFYVRTYAHDIGQALTCGAHLSELRRTRSGRFTLEKTLCANELKTMSREEIEPYVLSLADVSRMRGV